MGGVAERVGALTDKQAQTIAKLTDAVAAKDKAAADLAELEAQEDVAQDAELAEARAAVEIAKGDVDDLLDQLTDAQGDIQGAGRTRRRARPTAAPLPPARLGRPQRRRLRAGPRARVAA